MLLFAAVATNDITTVLLQNDNTKPKVVWNGTSSIIVIKA